MRLTCLLLTTLIAAHALADDAIEFARPELLMEAEELLQRLPEQLDLNPLRVGEKPSELSLIDVRPARERGGRVIRGAVTIDAGDWSAAFGDGSDTQGWTERIVTTLVHGPGSTVVVYDSTVTPAAARVWWTLRYWGVEDVRVLNGGSRAFERAGGELSLPMEVKTLQSQWRATPHRQRLATADDMLALTQGNRFPPRQGVVVDTRSPMELAEGMIATASPSDWTAYVDPVSGRMRSAAELNGLLDACGFDPQAPAVCYCRSGNRASVVALAMELMGGQRVANYVGSWNEWSKLPRAPIIQP